MIKYTLTCFRFHEFFLIPILFTAIQAIMMTSFLCFLHHHSHHIIFIIIFYNLATRNITCTFKALLFKVFACYCISFSVSFYLCFSYGNMPVSFSRFYWGLTTWFSSYGSCRRLSTGLLSFHSFRSVVMWFLFVMYRCGYGFG